jgi:hypothetical protein
MKGLRYPSEVLRGSHLCVVWRREESLVALETWRAGNEIETTDYT